jgi:hypothetical protein
VNQLFGLPMWLWVLLGLGLVAAGFVFARDRYRQARARRAIDNVISSVAYEQIHVNYLLLTQRGLLVIDLFDVQGLVFAGDKMTQWSVFGPKRHFTFGNPLPMLEERVTAVRLLAGDTPVEGRAVFSMRGDFPKGRPATVLRLDALQDEFPAVDRSQGGVAAALAPVWERIRVVAQPNPLTG